LEFKRGEEEVHMKTYTVQIAGFTRHLPIVQIEENLSIASFDLLGDVELVEVAAQKLAEKLPHVDVLITAEAKGIPLVYELSKKLQLPRYVVARKQIKSYMNQPMIHEVNSITTSTPQILAIGYEDAAFLNYKRVAIVDDVISSGSSLEALEALVQKAGGEIVAKACILVEGDSIGRCDVIHLDKLPLFTNHIPNPSHT